MIEPLASMEDLPEEVLLIIIQHLSVRDLSNCCAVSKRWRERFNTDSFWQRYCDSTLIHYLDIVPRQVNPLNHNYDDSSLCPLSYWRRSYMKEMELWNNWHSGNYKETSLPSHLCGYSDVPLLKKEKYFDKTLFFKDDLVLRAFEDYLHVYSFDDEHNLNCVFSVLFPIKSSTTVQLLVSGDKLLLVQDFNVLVFKLQISENLMFLQRTGKFQFGQYDKIRHGSYCIVITGCNMKNKCILDGDLFVTVFNTKDGEKISIWNIETQTIVKEECLPEDNINYKWIDIYHIDKETKNLLVGYSTKGYQDERRRDPYTEEVHFKIYNLTKTTFFPFILSILRIKMGYFTSSTCAIYDQFCAFIFGKVIRIYNYITNKLMYEGAASTDLTCLQKGFLFGLTETKLCFLEIPSMTEKHYIYELNLQTNCYLERVHFVTCNRFLVEYQQRAVVTSKPVVIVSALLDVRERRPKKHRTMVAKRTSGRVDSRVTKGKVGVKQSLTLYNFDGYIPLECNMMCTRLIVKDLANDQFKVLTFW